MKQLPPLLFTNPAHFSIRHSTLVRTDLDCVGHRYAEYATVLIRDIITSGVVSISISLCKLPKFFWHAQLSFGFMDSSFPVPKVGCALGNSVKNSVGLSSNGNLNFNTPSSNSFEDCHSELKEGDCVRMEVDLDSTPRTVQFFVNGEAGRCYVSGIPSSVRIGDTSFRIDNISRISQPTPISEGMNEVKC
ncbi:hypothetical protein BLNAU_7712 [Blattamonas nauphoetae]|uniref:SPRY domain-containing protein n=1 Tax=Blattamonas nauphoetae TaxID=2049346 RepID=A0ABQ9Y0V5_9EUKA|nr:hypothetical protein BLNAU_7712 [Blattamonas nauphoetae]